MAIARIVHQLWKNETVPSRWRSAVDSVRRYHKGFEYRLWTDETMDRHVREHHPEFYRAFAEFHRHIMRVDAFRYVLMQDFGGVYCDLDYEFVRPYAYEGADLVFSLEYDEQYGDPHNQIANYFFASVPGHPFWSDCIAYLIANPPYAPTPADVCTVTGPGLVTKMYYASPERYQGVKLTPKPVFSPRRVHGRRERKFYVNSGITYGFHHGWGTWRERWSTTWLARRLRKMLRLEEWQRRTGTGLPSTHREPRG
jgi:mannosyltransferase OCH1-like enzyme